jgi:AcrR family transcriptional regulator
MNTKERILDAALALFNEQGTHRVTTNHIAQGLEISPGNLYYHFRNKEEIIRALFERLTGEWAKTFTPPQDRPLVLADLETMLARNFEVLLEFRFFYRERATLIERDPELATRYQKNRRQGLANCQLLAAAFVESGVLQQPEQPDDLKNAAEVCWLIGDFWLSAVELDGDTVRPERLQHGLELLRSILRPYQTPDTAEN